MTLELTIRPFQTPGRDAAGHRDRRPKPRIRPSSRSAGRAARRSTISYSFSGTSQSSVRQLQGGLAQEPEGQGREPGRSGSVRRDQARHRDQARQRGRSEAQAALPLQLSGQQERLTVTVLGPGRRPLADRECRVGRTEHRGGRVQLRDDHAVVSGRSGSRNCRSPATRSTSSRPPSGSRTATAIPAWSIRSRGRCGAFSICGACRRHMTAPSSDHIVGGRALLFFNCAKIRAQLPPDAQSFSFEISCPAGGQETITETFYWLWDSLWASSLDDNLAHPYTTGDPFSPYPPTDPRSVMTVPRAFSTAAEADAYAAIMSPFGFMMVEARTETQTFSNALSWNTRISTYRRKVDFPLGEGVMPGWDVNGDPNLKGSAERFGAPNRRFAGSRHAEIHHRSQARLHDRARLTRAPATSHIRREPLNDRLSHGRQRALGRRQGLKPHARRGRRQFLGRHPAYRQSLRPIRRPPSASTPSRSPATR